VREFGNKTQDNMSSMLIFTESRSIFMESARQELEEEGKTLESSDLDNQLKNYVADNMSYDVAGIMNWGENAKERSDLMEHGVSAQEGQRQTRAAMLQ